MRGRARELPKIVSYWSYCEFQAGAIGVQLHTYAHVFQAPGQAAEGGQGVSQAPDSTMARQPMGTGGGFEKLAGRVVPRQ